MTVLYPWKRAAAAPAVFRLLLDALLFMDGVAPVE